MSNTRLVSLSMQGFETDLLKKADTMLGRFVVSEFSQTPFLPNFASFPYLLERYQKDMLGLATKVDETLQEYFSGEFTSVQVQTIVVEHPENAAWRLMRVRLDLRDKEGRTVQLARLVTTEGSKFLNIATENNGSLPITM